MSKLPLVSIIIPVYNGSNFMMDAIDSALSQTYESLEIIVVNDGSNDDGKTEQIALTYGDKINYFSKKNGGVASALNYAISKCNGKYVSWLSHDDVYYPDKIDKLLNILTEHPDNVILYSDYELIDENGKQIAIKRFNNNELNQKPLYSLLRGSLHGCSMLIPIKAFDDCGYFDESLKTTQDYDLWFKMRTKYSFMHVPEVLIKSRYHDEQDSKKHPEVIREANELWIKFANEVTNDEIYICENSKYVFYKNMYDFLIHNTPYAGAAKHIKLLAENSKKLLDEQVKKTLISVIIPFKNRIDWTIDSIHSVLSQTHKNFEIILIDNNSNEPIDKITKLVEKNLNIHLMSCEIPGAAAARNMGMEMASGEYIAFLDSDDLWLPEKLEKQIYFMLESGCQMSYTGYERYNDKITKKISSHKCKLGKIKFPELIGKCTIATPTVMVKNSFIKSNSLSFIECLSAGEDVFMWTQISYFTDILLLNRFYTIVREHNFTTANDSEIVCKSLVRLLGELSSRYNWDDYRHAIGPILRAIEYYYTINTPKKSLIYRVQPVVRLKRRLAKYPIVRKIYYKLREFC